ncbi:hypothetical protein I8752_35760 [Nostocaceae cyanobacterium CENA369]|uniref:Uncharacterized protein n=1 Tax=Dendronalium phyllosphericum CENA369 TaxID=1725256 RepID=A0A8J7IM02_9NOST|nr:hypothetical protein [Dendronalium phyllosphericum]MBH8578210.1 hypothetical protein [Dendronalium phyllosphericum CENA369]
MKERSDRQFNNFKFAVSGAIALLVLRIDQSIVCCCLKLRLLSYSARVVLTLTLC